MTDRAGDTRKAPNRRLTRVNAGVALALGILFCAAVRAADSPPGAGAPTLIISLYAKPAARAALRSALVSMQARALDRWRAEGLLSGYRLLFSRYADRDSWDAMEVLDFPSDAALAAWRKVERTAPGGLQPRVLGEIESLETAVTDRARSGGASTASDPAILVIPYQALVPAGEYLRYLDGYTLPQLRGWIAAGALDGFDIVICRYPADRRWNALLLLRYRDDAALARRDAVVPSVRSQPAGLS